MYIKKPHEVAQIIAGGQRMGEILEALTKLVKPGVSTAEIDAVAETMIRECGGIPAFKGYAPRGMRTPFPTTICASINEEVVHGIAAKEKILQDGDLFTIDIGMQWPKKSQKSKVQSPKSVDDERGYFTDTAVTIAVGNISDEARELMRVTKAALEAGIRACVVGNTIADIGRAVEKFVKSQGGYGIVRDLCGHGVGHAVHEEPYVLNYYDKKLETWKLTPGVVIAIEPMLTLGGHAIETKEDEWTIVTADGSLSAHEEHTIVITEDGPVVATRRPHEKAFL